MSYQRQVFQCCKTGNLQLLKHLCEDKNVELNVRDMWDSTPLYYACLCGHYNLVEYLLQNGARCPQNTFDGERCLYGALTNDIKNLLKNWKQVAGSHRNKYFEMLSNLCEKGLFSDVKFLVHDQSFHLHRFVLATRSPYFAEAFCNKWRNRKVVSIRNSLISVEAFSSVMQYIYTGRLSMHISNIDDVRRLACNCQLQLLSEEIERVLVRINDLIKLKPSMKNKVKVLTVESEECYNKLFSDFLRLTDHVIPPDLRNWVPEGTLPFTRMWRELNLHPDITFDVEGHYFLAHKAFFCTASDYFRAVMDDHFKENEQMTDTNTLPVYAINNIGRETFQSIVIFIYTGHYDSDNENAVLETLCTSHMLLFHDLSRRCGQILSRFLEEYNVVDYYRLSKNFDLGKLETQCTMFMARELDKMVDRADFAELVEQDASSVTQRQDIDSIPLIDDIRFNVTNSLTSISQMAEAAVTLASLDALLARLGREC